MGRLEYSDTIVGAIPVRRRLPLAGLAIVLRITTTGVVGDKLRLRVDGVLNRSTGAFRVRLRLPAVGRAGIVTVAVGANRVRLRLRANGVKYLVARDGVVVDKCRLPVAGTTLFLSTGVLPTKPRLAAAGTTIREICNSAGAPFKARMADSPINGTNTVGALPVKASDPVFGVFPNRTVEFPPTRRSAAEAGANTEGDSELEPVRARTAGAGLINTVDAAGTAARAV